MPYLLFLCCLQLCSIRFVNGILFLLWCNNYEHAFIEYHFLAYGPCGHTKAMTYKQQIIFKNRVCTTLSLCRVCTVSLYLETLMKFIFCIIHLCFALFAFLLLLCESKIIFYHKCLNKFVC